MLPLLVLGLLVSLVHADYAPSLCDESNLMSPITLAAPWPLRQEAGGAVLNQPFTFVPKGQTSAVTWPAGTIAIMGGKAAFNDVWISSDNAQTWTLLSGSAWGEDGAYTANSLADGTRTAMCHKANSDVVYVVAGTFDSAKTSRVQRGNLISWNQITMAAAFPAREHTQCLVDSDENVYVFGGLDTASMNDIWRSARGENPWTRMTSAATWPARDGLDAVLMSTNDRLLSQTGEIMYIANGVKGSLRLNDVWASADRGSNWYLITPSAPYYKRMDGNMAVNSAGVLVVSGGDCGSECNLNDIWASLDGGFTWGQCCNHCGFNNREDQVTVFDRDGHLIVMSGAQTWPAFDLAHDVWRSSISFTDVNAVSATCNIPVPTCGVGLKCLPGGYCPCAPINQSPANPTGTGVTMNMIGIAPWKTGRNEGGLAARTSPLTFVDAVDRTTKTFATSLIFYGGKYGSTYYNDVWASSDNGVSWSMISGSYNGSSVGTNHLIDSSRSADCEDNNGRMYMIGGTPRGTSVFSSAVWASSDGIDWSAVTDAAPFWPREASMCTTDSAGNVYIFGGSHKVYSRLNDVWKSSNGGRDWTLQTMHASWKARTQHDAATLFSQTLQKDILYVLNGIWTSPYAANRNNDIWASSDSGLTWIQITAAAQFRGRQDSDTDVVGNVMVVTGGDSGTDSPGNVNDIWASIDGGYTWGMCNMSAGYTPREDQAVAFTPEGHLVLAGGSAPWVSADAKVWRSEGSFSDITYVSTRCGLAVPWCGAGINCWPSATQRCDKNCPAQAIPISSSSTAGPAPGVSSSRTPNRLSSSSSAGSAAGVSSSSSSGTSVGVAVGVCFLGLGVGLIIAFVIAWCLYGNSSKQGKRFVDEPSSNRGHNMEMSRVEHETA